MIERCVFSSTYLGVGLAIATGLIANLGSVSQSRAQADLNIQSRLDSIMPPASAQLPNSSASSAELARGRNLIFVPLKNGAGVFVPPEKFRSIVIQVTKQRAKNFSEMQKNAPLSTPQAKAVVESLSEVERSQFEELIQTVNPNTAVVTRQPPSVQMSFPFNPTYETNILRSGNNNNPGESAGFGGGLTVASGVEGRPWDFVILNAQEASTRYTPNFSPSVDGASAQASYQLFLHAYGYNPSTKTFVDNLVPGSPVPPLPVNTTTFDTATFSVVNQMAFAPTFKNEKTDFLTPQISLARQNIGLDDSSGKPCVTSDKFCYYANLSLTAGQSFSDVRTLENVNFAASATLGWNIPNSSWSLTLPATATAKDYEYVVGGRHDLQLQAGPALSYSSPKVALSCEPPYKALCGDENISFIFKLPVTYYKNYSTLSTAAWSGWVIMPTLTITFGYTGPIPTGS